MPANRLQRRVSDAMSKSEVSLAYSRLLSLSCSKIGHIT